jgi:hypothetical protein
MRIFGLLLVLLGALALGYQCFEFVMREQAAEGGGQALGAQKLSIPPVVGGIAVVGGLLLVASDTRRGQN